MRDLLTVLAGLVILVLVAALVVPPFVDWGSQRAYVDLALSRAAGLPVRTEGAIDIRLLPTPRLHLERVGIGARGTEDTSLDAQDVEAEIALTPLLSGEVRFLGSRVGRMEIKLPAGSGGDWRVPRALLSDETLGRAWVFEDLAVGQLILTAVDARTGRTEQGFAERVQLQSQAMAGPWRAEGQVGATRFTLVTGEIALAGATNVKLSTEGAGQPRVSLDARVMLDAAAGDVLVPRFEGTARLTGLRDAVPVPYLVTASFKTSGRTGVLDNVSIEAGEGGAARLAGTGQIALDERRLTLALDGRRLDLDALAKAYRDTPETLRETWRPQPGFPISATFRLDGLALAGEELSGLTARLALAGDRLEVERLEFTAPGQTRVTAAGELSTTVGGGMNGRVTLATRSADRLAAYLGRLGITNVAADALAGRPLEASADIVAAHPIASLRNLNVRLGDATVTGALRYTGAETSTRARIDAQIAIQGLDLGSLPPLTGVFDASRTLDLGLILDARNVGYGAGERGGRVAARFTSEGSGLTIDLLEIADLAGANASLRGRITPDGAGRIGGRLRARRAAPLVDLVGRVSLGGLADLIPTFLREAPLDAAVLVSSVGGGSGGAPALSTKLSGSAGGGGLEAEITSAEGRVSEVSATLSSEDFGAWFGRAGAASPARPAKLNLAGRRDGGGRLSLGLSGDVAGVKIATTEPFALSEREGGIESGAAALSTDDLRPILALYGQSFAEPVDAEMKARVGRRDGLPRIELDGHVADSVVDADLAGASARDLSGRVLLGRVSLPWVAATLALGPPPAQTAGTGAWVTARFGDPPALPFGGTVSVRTVSADLGRGFAAERAEFTLATIPDGFAIRDLGAAFLGGRAAGTLTVTRQGGLAAIIGEGSLSDVDLAQLAGRPFAGRIGGTLRFGGSGESPAGIVANLGGAGTVAVERLQVASADPAAVLRAAQRALRGEDTLAAAKLAGIAAEELDRGALSVPTAQGQATFVSGALRISPLMADAGDAVWQGSAGIDFRTMALDVRGALTSRSTPRNWAGAAPYLGLGWSGPLGRPTRTLDVGPLSNGLASVVLTRELDRIETFELDAAERMRVNGRVEMDRARRAAAEEAARLARQREETERARIEAEGIMSGGRTGEQAPPRTP